MFFFEKKNQKTFDKGVRVGAGVRLLALAVTLVLAPGLASARVGQGLSMGSRGSRTYATTPGTATAPGGGAAIGNSYTPYSQSSYGQSSYGGYGMRPRSPFATGLLGGFLGAGLGGLLFGRGFFGGLHGGTGLLGLLLQLFILYMIGSWLYRRFAGGVALAGGGGMLGRMMGPGMMRRTLRPAPLGARRTGRPISLTHGDYQTFEQLLRHIQAAWSAHDLQGLRAMATPEMLGYFGEQLAGQVSRGVRNQVSDVRLQRGDLVEAWSEGPREYATVAMQFSMVDVTRDRAGRVVDGSPSERVTVTELWTFLRAPAASWTLSAIQQSA
jgi:predicted lipid-binding transport protein (Tim44 family)